MRAFAFLYSNLYVIMHLVRCVRPATISLKLITTWDG